MHDIEKALRAIRKEIQKLNDRLGVSGQPLAVTAYTKKQAADLLNVSVKTIDRRIDSGVIHVVRQEGHPRIPRSELERFLRVAPEPRRGGGRRRGSKVVDVTEEIRKYEAGVRRR